MTLDSLTAALVVSLCVLIVSQAFLVYGFALVMLRWRRPPLSDEECPKTAIILCLRGGDPFLKNCITSVLNQDYPTYELRVIVDSHEDPAWEIVMQLVEQSGATNVQIQQLRDPQQSCSLKCSSVTQAVSDLDESFEVVALLDADTVPHRTWLRELVAPLKDESVGATTGNRWYMPKELPFAALIRYIWNAAAIVQMYWFGIAWGGTLALKTKVLRESDLLTRWGSALCEDTMLYRALRELKLRIVFVPSLLMVNRETCDLSGFFHWVRRQLMTARLYHPNWKLVLFHGLSTTILPAMIVIVLLVALATQKYSAATYAAGGLFINELSIILMILPLEWSLRPMMAKRDVATSWMGGLGFAKFLLAIPMTQVVYAAALVSSLLLRNIDWRGVSYRIDGPWKIHMVEYRPFKANDGAADKSMSL